MKQLIIILTLFLTLTAVNGQDAKKPTGTSSSFTGRIINLTDSSIEVKKGSMELTFRLNESVRIEKNGKSVDSKALKLCQQVKIFYKKVDNNRTISKVIILQESYCSE